jgi:BNR repeat protein
MTKRTVFILTVIGMALSVFGPGVARADWQDHTVSQLNGEGPRTALPGKFQYVPVAKPELLITPYLAYLPEKDRVVMLLNRDRPHMATLIHSDDRGARWSPMRWLSCDEQGRPNANTCVGLTYLGEGKFLVGEEGGNRFFGSDYGETWSKPVPIPPPSIGGESYSWDPMLVERDAQTGKVRLTEVRWRRTGVPRTSSEGPHSEAFLRHSEDGGTTWSKEVFPPEWKGIDEVALIRAANKDLVAACRTNPPKRYCHLEFDHYEGLAVSISKDDGKTWSKRRQLYEYGRHHPSLVLMPDETLVMVYNVRLGYPDTEDGFPQYGIEAVVSRDHGQTWDFGHRYILVTYKGAKPKKGDVWWSAATQGTSSILLPDGSILTSFGSGYRVNPSPAPGADTYFPRDIGLIRWKPKG